MISQHFVSAGRDVDQRVPEDLVGRLYRAGENAVSDVVDGLSPADRANLAVYCYRKSHLHEIGLAIAATCDLPTLVQSWGTAVGQVIFAQSRDWAAERSRPHCEQRSKITLPKFPVAEPGSAALVPFEMVDETDEDDEIGSAAA